MDPTRPVKVFLSYSQDSDAHCQRVRRLADRLRDDGIDSVLDQYEASPPQGWPAWMAEQIREANFVLVLTSEGYLHKATDCGPRGGGRGVKFESVLIIQDLYNARMWNERFIPVLLDQISDDLILEPLQPYTYYRLDVDYDKLYRRLTGQLPPKPVLGAVRNLPTPEVLDENNQAENPFDHLTPARPPRFKGRHDLLQRLEMYLGDGMSTSVVGYPRIGKSSLLATWSERVAATGRTVRLLDGDGPAGASPGALVGELTGRPAPEEPDAAADALAAWVERHGEPGLPPLLLVDELDGMVSRFPPRFFERWRGLLGRFVLVLASRREIDDLYEDTGRTSPFANRLRLEWLGLLEREAAAEVVALGNGTLEAADRRWMERQAGCHPFFLQLLGRHLAEARRTCEDAQAARERARLEAFARLKEIVRRLDARDQDALRSGRRDQGRLHVRGLVEAGGEPFGEVLSDWLRDRS